MGQYPVSGSPLIYQWVVTAPVWILMKLHWETQGVTLMINPGFSSSARSCHLPFYPPTFTAWSHQQEDAHHPLVNLALYLLEAWGTQLFPLFLPPLVFAVHYFLDINKLLSLLPRIKNLTSDSVKINVNTKVSHLFHLVQERASYLVSDQHLYLYPQTKSKCSSSFARFFSSSRC